MERRLLTLVAILCVSAALVAQAPRAVGRVQSRNGYGLSGCQLDFFFNDGRDPLSYRVYTDQGGTFFIDAARPGPYLVVILQGGRRFDVHLTVSNDQRRFFPEVLEVPW